MIIDFLKLYEASYIIGDFQKSKGNDTNNLPFKGYVESDRMRMTRAMACRHEKEAQDNEGEARFFDLAPTSHFQHSGPHKYPGKLGSLASPISGMLPWLYGGKLLIPRRILTPSVAQELGS